MNDLDREEDSDEDGRLLNGIHEARAKALDMDGTDGEDEYDTDEFYNSAKFTRSSNAAVRAGSQESTRFKVGSLSRFSTGGALGRRF